MSDEKITITIAKGQRARKLRKYWERSKQRRLALVELAVQSQNRQEAIDGLNQTKAEIRAETIQDFIMAQYKIAMISEEDVSKRGEINARKKAEAETELAEHLAEVRNM